MSTVEQKTSVVVDTPAVSAEPASILLLLDKSGSMTGNRTEILQSVNNFVRDQQSKPADGTTLSILTFNEKVDVLFNSKRLADVAPLGEADYHPDCMTALYDAIGHAIDDHAGRKRVLMVIVTDGQENASRKYTKQTITAKIEQTKAIGWNFIFLANDLDTSAGGDGIGLGCAAADAVYSGTNNIAVGYDGMGAALERCVSAAATCYRQTSYVPNLNHMSSEGANPRDNSDVQIGDNVQFGMPGLQRTSSMMSGVLPRMLGQRDLLHPTAHVSRDPSTDSSDL